MFPKRTPLLAGAASLLLASCADHGVLPTEPTVGPLDTSFDVTIAATGPGPMTSVVSGSVCVDVSGGTDVAPTAGARVVAWACHGGNNQRFALQSNGSITAYNGARCLDVWGAAANDGDPVVAWTCHGGANQKWTRTAAGELRSAVNGKCLDLWGARGENGARLVVWSCHGGANQKWVLNDAAAASPPPIASAPVVTETGGSAELPRIYLDTSVPAVTGRTINVAVGGNLQAALDAAQPGDEVVLPAGATYVGNFALRPKLGTTATQWITVRSAGALPAPGTRVTPANASQMPKILTPTASSAVWALPGAQGWRLVGLEVSATSAAPFVYNMLAFGSSGAEQSTLAQVPSRLVLDRSYVHGSSTLDVRRCVLLNSAASAVVDSYLADCHSNTSDSQAIMGSNGPGPLKISNNYMEAGQEVILFGGADPSVPGLVPSDIEIRRNHVTRPLSWRGKWQVKNLLELKAGQRLLIEGNVFENNWADAQNGFAFLWWSLNAEGSAPWSVTQDITFRYNRVANVPQAFNIDVGNNPAQPTRRITITQNVITGTDGAGARVFQVGTISGLTITNNSGIGGGSGVFFTVPDQPLPTFVFRDNITGGQYNFFAGGSMGGAALQRLAIPAASVTGNVVVVASASDSWTVPSGNTMLTSVGAIGFTDYAAGDLSLRNSSPVLTTGTGGSRPGADMAAVAAATNGVR